MLNFKIVVLSIPNGGCTPLSRLYPTAQETPKSNTPLLHFHSQSLPFLAHKLKQFSYHFQPDKNSYLWSDTEQLLRARESVLQPLEGLYTIK